jgi:hypothetical protein
MRLITGISSLLILGANAAFAQEEIYLTCTYERTVENDGKVGATSGEMSVSVRFMLPLGKPKNLLIKTTKAPCYEFIGDGSEIRIEGTCNRVVAGMKYVSELAIKPRERRFRADRNNWRGRRFSSLRAVLGGEEDVLRYLASGGSKAD